MRTAFHPQRDGQMECIKQVVEPNSRSYFNYEQNDWSEMLAMVVIRKFHLQKCTVTTEQEYTIG
jgi:hypothetical protein